MKAFAKLSTLVGRVRESLCLFILLASPLAAQVTFPVDEGLPLPPEREIYAQNGSQGRTLVGKTRSIPKHDSQWTVSCLKQHYHFSHSKYDIKCYAHSFEGDTLGIVKQDVMFKFFVKAFAEHRPIVLSPDMVWMLIGQGFSHYVNENAEQLRDLLVNHPGKKTLEVMVEEDMLAPQADWEPVLSKFFDEIFDNSKDDIAHLVTADFSTTGRVERMASRFLLMDVMKQYFNYELISLVCGIPSITLEGTPADWQKVLDKTRQLEKYGLGWWVNDLTPILQEFVNASKGKVNTRFWQDIVMKYHPEQMTTTIRGCGPRPKIDSTTIVDGWFLKFFPFCQDGRTPLKVRHDYSRMLSEMSRVPFKYRVIGSGQEKVYPMEFWTGFVGVEEDEKTLALRPKIGWMVMEAEPTDPVSCAFFHQQVMVIVKDVSEIPAMALKLGGVGTLDVSFVDSIRVPDWIGDINVGSIRLEGKFDDATLSRVKQLLPDRVIDTLGEFITIDSGPDSKFNQYIDMDNE